MDGSRLERMIARLTAQKAWLDHAASRIGDRPGIVLEIGLGKGRTFDHLRLSMPQREIHAFDGSLHAPSDCTPGPEQLHLGDFRETLPLARRDLGRRAVLVHADFGSEDADHDQGQALWLGPLVAALVVEGGYVISDRPLDLPGWQPLRVPAPLAWSYWGWRVVDPFS